jgi:Spy/CpxP family protein refolding chaperone
MRLRTAIGASAIVLGVVVTVGVAAATDDDGDDQPAQVGRLTEMEQSGEMHDILELHRQMLERMQDDASPAMLELMNNDPMWQMMRSDDWPQMDEQHQADIDRMLGRGAP